MKRQIYVNLPVNNLERSIAFFTTIGFTLNQQFTNEDAACMVIEDNIYAMLLKNEFFSTFTLKQIADAKNCTEVLVCLSCDCRDEVDELVRKAVAAGGTAPRPPVDYGGYMYSHGFEDLDGHMWELVYMDESQAV